MLPNRSMSNIDYGIGMPEGIASVLHEENQEIYFTPSVEPGAVGGTPLGGLTFGGLEVAINDGKLRIIQEALNKKFLKHVEQITSVQKCPACQ